MWLRTVNFVGLMFVVSSSATEICKPKSCARKVNNEKAFCGSDGVTYPNKCHFEKAKCLNSELTTIRKGPCKQQKTCAEIATYSNENPNFGFKPNCRADGSFAASQCHQGIGSCWCVTPQGIPLTFTSAPLKVGAKHRCGKKKKSTRRSPAKKNRPKPCKPGEKALFNSHLLDSFQQEWKREKKSTTSATDSILLEWKFVDLDLNGDGILDKQEYKDLKRLVKKAVKPKKCAKNFLKSCDVNANLNIEKQEWMECITRSGLDDGGQNTSNLGEDSDEYVDGLPNGHPSAPAGVLTSDGAQETTSCDYDDDCSSMREEDPADCLTDRKTALAEDSQYIPDCTPDGRYQKVQCYKSAGYCWCVHEDSGKNIPGTSVKDGVPKCDELVPTNRTMKGCPEEKKQVFLKDLFLFLENKTSSTTKFNDPRWQGSKAEQIAQQSFAMFDVNKNKVLDRNEWKLLKEMVISVNMLKKCGKKLPRYCDINKDRQISMTEWLACLNVQQSSSSTIASPKNMTSSRFGKKNPLTMLLED